MASQAPVVTQADIDAYIASYQKAQADQAAALAAAQATGMSDRYTQLYGGADIIPGTTQGILSNMGIQNPYLPVYSLIGSESVGNDLANERMQFAPTPGVSYRLVDKNTGETTTATTPEEIKALIAQSNALSAAGGKGTNLAIESNQTGSWSPVFTDQPNPLFSDITKLALAGMVLATGAGLAQPGGLGGLSSAGATGAGAAGAGTAAGAAGLAPVATVAAAAPAAAAATTDLVVTALMAQGFTAAQAAALVATGGAAAALSSSGAAGSTTGTTAASNATNTMPPATTTGPDLLLTAQQTGSTIPAVVPAAAAATTAAATSGGSAGVNTTKTMPEATTTGPDLTLTAPTSILPAVIGTGAVGGGVALADALSNAAASNAMGAETSFADTAATRTSLTPEQLAAINAGAGAGGVFGTGLTAGQLATIGGLGASAIGSLFGGSGSGGTGTGTPYVSPFGAGPAIGGADFRVNPNIQDYERYGFGGEATFFRPEYNKLVSSGASMGGAPIGGTTTTTPTYTPLIGGTTTGGTTATGGATTGGTTAVTKQERPAGFTGVVSGQQVGDTQVVDGTTWSYGGDQAGWQMQYKDPTTGNLALLPGNGATNVSSFKNNPTVAVNQPYFAQNTANIPGWAETYQGFQRGLMSQGITGDTKAAAERELFSAIETQPFANPQALVDYARGIYNKYTTPSPVATNTKNTGGILGALTNAGMSTQSPLNMTQEQKANFINALAPGYDPNQPMVWNGPYVPSGNPMPIGNLPEGAANVARGLIG
jgi:hypothetical protein